MSEPSDWIEWSGGTVPVDGTDARGYVQFIGESRERAERRGITILEHWPWFGEDEKPCVCAYRVVQP